MNRQTFSFLSLGTLLLGLCFLFSCSAQTSATGSKANPSETTVYIVRHGEKAPSSGAMTDDPSLSETGKARAQALKAQLGTAPVKALYATKYKRTQETLQPLSEALKLPVQIYEASDFAGLAAKVKEAHAGQTVVIAGHSNTVLSLVEAFGVQKPFAAVADHEYDYLFKVTLTPDQPATVQVMKYGAASVAPAK
ncbi:histidine phosphatase family protein [Nibribacter ruber]|uniref:Histidine phosphatase family protein n=1 Tax=Nibribacter ruber TaxID=2698458 RepID=A0A6P1P487_9BACT|nr:histidine phosphatase family protein [Nibribacter ruber]QHL89138.1 histidine phosphatase family protein [Nibribacter ruber]